MTSLKLSGSALETGSVADDGADDEVTKTETVCPGDLLQWSTPITTAPGGASTSRWRTSTGRYTYMEGILI